MLALVLRNSDKLALPTLIFRVKTRRNRRGSVCDGIQIRRLMARDHSEWHALWAAYLDVYSTSVPEAVYTATFGRCLDRHVTDQQAFVAKEEGRLIGLVHIIYHPHHWRIEKVCYLQDLYVIPESRGKGAATALIKAVYEAADMNGTPSVYWMTQAFNHRARRLYDNIANLTPFIKYQQ